jgi:hypothetical protein
MGEPRGSDMDKRKKVFAVAVAGILLAVIILGFAVYRSGMKRSPERIGIEDVLDLTSARNDIPDAILVDAGNPVLGLIAVPISCWYDISGKGNGTHDGGSSDNGGSGLRPLLAVDGGSLNAIQERFIEDCGYGSMLYMGSENMDLPSGSAIYSGSPTSISLQAASDIFKSTSGALIVDDTKEGYELGILAAPLASYLNVPVIIADRTSDPYKITSVLRDLGAQYIIALGERNEFADRIDLDQVRLKTSEEITNAVLTVIKDRFERIDYLVLSNPADILPPKAIASALQTYDQDVTNLRVETSQIKGDIVGESESTFSIDVPDGIQVVRIYINFTDLKATPLDPLKDVVGVDPSIFATLYDPDGGLSTYAPSFSREPGKDYLEVQTFDRPGSYALNVKVFYGIKGLDTYAGTSLGVSRIDGSFHIDAWTTTLETPHLPTIPNLSMLSPYLAASHGGMVVADPDFEVTTEGYAAEGSSTGPCYSESLHPFINGKVGSIEKRLNDTLDILSAKGMLEDYIGGHAWLSILAGPDMVPQYYQKKDPSWEEDAIYGLGWPTDLNYSLGLKLSVARTIGHDVPDTSCLIARTLFYERYSQGHASSIKGEYGSSEEWGSNFHFVAGELGGRTGWFFWQRSFSTEVKSSGFQTEEYMRNSENDRQTMVARGAYERANYLDLMMHGNWYWYVTELNGADSYSTSVKVSDLATDQEDWELGPSVVVTGSCILGRTDGIPPGSSLTMAFLHAGVNAFFGATRSTGSEAKAGTIETSLIYDDLSVGEAMRADKTVNQEPAAYYVRVLFADPAFNPYEPNNGYSDQGRPILVKFSG